MEFVLLGVGVLAALAKVVHYFWHKSAVSKGQLKEKAAHMKEGIEAKSHFEKGREESAQSGLDPADKFAAIDDD